MSLPKPHSAGCALVVFSMMLCTAFDVSAQSGFVGHGHSLSQATSSEPSDTAAVVQSSNYAQGTNVDPIDITAGFATRFQEGNEQVLLLRGPCEIRQGDKSWTAPQMVLWELTAADALEKRVLVYLEGNSEEAAVEGDVNQRKTHPHFLVEVTTSGRLTYAGRTPVDVPQANQEPLYIRAMKERTQTRGAIKTVQFTNEIALPPLPQFQASPVPMIRRHVTISPRFLGERLEFKVEQTEGTLPAEYVITVTGGVNIVVDNVPLQVEGRTILTRVDLTADKAVVWTNANRMGEIGSFDIDENTPFQVYLEGNLVVLQGTTAVRASHAFYDISQKRGLLMNAEIRTQLPDYEGTLRLRAAEVRQFSEMNFHAKNAWISTSEFGDPKWKLQASDITIEERLSNGRAPNPITGQPDTTLWVTGQRNRLFIEGIPVAGFPYLSAPAGDPRIPIRRLNAGYSGLFGFEFESAFTLDGVLGLNLPKGTDWTLEANYYSERGPALGTRTEYDFDGALLGLPAHHRGTGHAIYQYDDGRDNLGLDRRNLNIEDNNRGRILLHNRTDLSPNTWIQADVGHVLNNDRNYMEQFFENEWDTGQDLENTLSIHHQYDNLSASVLGSGRSNNFENQTDWLPKLDLTVLGEPVLGSPLLWSMHSSAGYAHSRPAEAPTDPNDAFAPLPYYQDIGGTVLMSRHELSLPFNLGPVNIAPYVLGEIAHWQEDLQSDELTRLYGSAGVRASVQFSKYMPGIRNSLLGLNGLAHKVTYDLDYYIAESSEDFSDIPQYNNFDDNAQERFIERFIVNEYGGTLPAMFDARNYAIRSGAGRSVSDPYHELVDDQQVVKLGMHHRWQTKVGPADRPRIVDWMELDLGASLFPDADRDNFGETLGLINARYAWHVGARTSVLASGVADIFDTGQQVWNVGLLNQRPGRGSFYVGYRNINVGPIESQLITGSMSYVLSPNLYIATLGSSYDLAEGIDRGQSLTLTRIGEYFLLHFGFGYDRSRNNVGAALLFEPKFGSYGRSSMQLNSLLGIQ